MRFQTGLVLFLLLTAHYSVLLFYMKLVIVLLLLPCRQFEIQRASVKRILNNTSDTGAFEGKMGTFSNLHKMCIHGGGWTIEGRG